jgi:hypothetical protein
MYFSRARKRRTAMSINPYESPRGLPTTKHRKKVVPVPIPVPDSLSIIVVAIAAIAGGTFFIAVVEGLHLLAFHDVAFQTGVAAGIAATFSVLTAADGRIQRQEPAWGSALIGMLLASPFALAFAVVLALQAYGLATKRVPGAALVSFLCYASFFLTLSVGGWLAICRTRSVQASETFRNVRF